MVGYQDDLTAVKKALIGDDMRGGVVRDIADIKGKVNNGGNGGNGGLGKRERAMIYVSLIGTGGLVVGELIKVVFH